MDQYLKVGPLIKDFRKFQEMSRNELAKDICHPSYISRLEKGDRCPNVIILKQIANKLKIPIAYFFDVLDNENANELNLLRKEIFVLHSKGNYSKMVKVIDNNFSKFKITSLIDKQLLYTSRVKAISIVNEEYDKGIDELQNSLDSFVEYKSLLGMLEYCIRGSIGSLYLYKRDFYNARKILNKLYKVRENIICYSNFDSFPRLYSKYILLSLLENEIDIAKLVLKEGFHTCERFNASPILGELYLLKGVIYLLEGKEDLAIDNINKGNVLHEVLCSNNNEYYKLIVNVLKEELNIDIYNIKKHMYMANVRVE